MKQKDEVLGVRIVGGLEEMTTPWAGISLLVESLRRCGVEAVANRVLPAKGVVIGKRFKKHGISWTITSFFLQKLARLY